MKIENEFIPYTEAFALKELGFNEKCIGIYYNNGKKFLISETLMTNSELDSYNSPDSEMSTPLYQQAFRWFREKYNLHGVPVSNNFNKWKYRITSLDESIILEHGCDQKYWIMGGFSNLYEEAELECLKKLIEIVKTK